MPSARSRFAVFDTSAYVENFRTGRFTLRMLQSPLVPRCSSVVLHELLRGARTATEVGFVRDLLRRFSANGGIRTKIRLLSIEGAQASSQLALFELQKSG